MEMQVLNAKSKNLPSISDIDSSRFLSGLRWHCPRSSRVSGFQIIILILIIMS